VLFTNGNLNNIFSFFHFHTKQTSAIFACCRAQCQQKACRIWGIHSLILYMFPFG